MTIRVCSPRGSEWPAEYRSYAVELHRQFQAGVIGIAELQCRLSEKYPEKDLPNERTMRRWAHEKYSDLPEQRAQFLKAQGVRPDSFEQQVLAVPQVYRLSPVLIPEPSMTSRISALLNPMMQFVLAMTMVRLVASVGESMSQSLNK